jgi:hypothetical protein
MCITSKPSAGNPGIVFRAHASSRTHKENLMERIVHSGFLAGSRRAGVRNTGPDLLNTNMEKS